MIIGNAKLFLDGAFQEGSLTLENGVITAVGLSLIHIFRPDRSGRRRPWFPAGLRSAAMWIYRSRRAR